MKLKESVNKSILCRILRTRSSKISAEQYKILSKIEKHKGASYYVNYAKSEYNGELSGRYFARSKGSIQLLQRKLRGLLCNGLYVDVDMRNSNYVILENLARKYNIEHDYLSKFNTSREEILNRVGNSMGLSRDIMKELYSSLVCGGSLKTWMSKYNIETCPYNVNKLMTEIDKIRKILLSQTENHKYKKIAYASKKNDYNLEGSALSFLLQDIESEILCCFVHRAKEHHKIRAGVLMHDGCLFHYDKGDTIPNHILRDLEEYVNDKLGYKINLICKAHEIDPELIDDSKMEEVYEYYVNNMRDHKMDEVYTSEGMKSYPMDKAITCIKANPGVGKTLELENLTKRIPKDKRILIISYNVTLCKKYHATFGKYGFKLYNEMTYSEYQNERRIIICLDSIYKIPLNNDEFDYIYMDECLSVFEHFSSSVMREVSLNIETLTSCLMQCQHIYFIDANVDSGMIYDVVKWLEKNKNVKSYWIQNTYIRETNRRVYFMDDTNEQGQISHILSLLSKKKKIVCPCSSKTFVDTLYETAKKIYPNLRIKKYNSESSRVELYADSMNPNEAWSDLDLLIYSPTISAGVSFEGKHFDVCIGIFESSMSYGIVNNCYQQLFRVRQLIDGDMYIYCNCYKYYSLSITKDAVESELDKNVNGLSNVLENSNKFLELDSKTYKRGFNKRALSYEIIKNILLSKNQSLMYFKSILKNGLHDNGIKYENYIDSIEIEKIEICKSTEDKKMREQFIFEFEENRENLVLNRTEMMNIEKAISGCKVDVPKTDKIKRNITLNLCNWNSEITGITLDFYKEYVLSVNEGEQKCIRSIIACGHRYNRLDKELCEDYERIRYQLSVENNFELFQNLQKTGHTQTLVGKRILIEVFGCIEGNILECILNKKFKDTDWKPNLIKYLKEMTTDDYKSIIRLFKLHIDKSVRNTKTSYKYIKNFETTNSKLPCGFVRTVMKQTFNIDFVQSPCKNYMIFKNTFWEELTKNNVTFLTNNSRFIEIDDFE